MNPRLAVAAAVLALAACGESDSFSGDPFPIYVDRAAGAFLVQVRVGDDPPRPVVLDVLSPITVLDPTQPTDPPSRRSVSLALLGHRTPGSAELLTRARFSTSAIYLHPCETAPCTIGAPGAPTPITGVIGAETLSGDAIRFRSDEDRLEVLADIAGDGPARDRTCDAEMPSPFYGGGTLVLGGTEVTFPALRIALAICLSPTPDAVDPFARGTDAAMLLSTGIGPSIIGAQRYQAWAAAKAGRPSLASLPPATVQLSSGPIQGRLGRLDGFAVVGDATPPRGACREVYSHHLLTARDCVEGDDCPCSDGDIFCGAPSVIELATSIEALVVPDDDPILQALRAELRPDLPEIDGILGASALASTELDVDYPHNRLLFRCLGAGCALRPALRDRDSRPVIEQCVAKAVPAIDAGVDADDGDGVAVPTAGP